MLHLLPLYVAGWFLWKLIYKKSALDNVSGPPTDSFWTGKHMSSVSRLLPHEFLGVLPQLYSPDAWVFHKEILGKCNMILCPFVVLMTLADGGVAKIKSFLGVRLSPTPLSRYSCLWNRKTSSSSPTLKLCTNSLSKFVSRQLFLPISSMALPGSAHS